MEIGKKVLFQNVVYLILEKVFQEATMDMDDEDWEGYKVQNVQTGEIELISMYRLENEGVTLSKLEEWKESKERQIRILTKELESVENKLEKFRAVLS